MKIVLINPPIREWAAPNVFPLGIGYLAACLKKEGYQVEVLDLNALRLSKEEIECRVRDLQFDVAGIGGLITTYRFIKWLIPLIRKYHGSKKIIAGGTVATTIPRILLTENEIDIAVLGEGEHTLVALLNALSRGTPLSQVSGIAFMQAGEMVRNPPREEIADLDSIPFPDWDLFPMDVYFRTVVDHKTGSKWQDGHKDEGVFKKQFREIAMVSSRGCPYTCIYCYHYHMGKLYRFRSARNMIEEIKLLKDKFDIQSVQFLDDCFVIRKDRVFEFCDLLIKERLDLSWGCNGRVNIVDEEMFKRMRETGCTNVDYGIESGSQKILDIMRKNVTVQQAKDALLMTRKYFGEAGKNWNFTMMIGTPGETKETIAESIAFCRGLEMSPDAVFFTTAFPGTELYERARARGLIKDEEEYISSLWEMGEQMLINFTEMSDEELIGEKAMMVRAVGAGNVYVHPKVEY
jgi:anaerobic magnesium-protoporphyrin IX monomethyl ester cyclase